MIRVIARAVALAPIVIVSIGTEVLVGGVHVSWTRAYTGDGRGTDQGNALALGPNADVYVAVRAWGALYRDYDCVVLRYDSLGNPVWERRTDGLYGGYDSPAAIALDPFGNILVAGRTQGIQQSRRYLTLKYDPDGNLLWSQSYPGGEAADVATDSAGNVYVTGDAGTLKYGPDGSLQWVVGPGIQLALDADANAYVRQANAISKFSSSGLLLWSQPFPGLDGLVGTTAAIGVDANDNVFVTGTATAQGGVRVFVTARYAEDGSLTWVQTHPAASGDDTVTDIAVDRSGGACVAGTVTVIKYDSAGNVEWSNRISKPAYDHLGPTLVRLDTSGNAYVTRSDFYDPWPTVSRTFLVCYAPDGTERWFRRSPAPYGWPELDDRPTDIAIDNRGGVYITGTGWAGSPSAFWDAVTYKYEEVDCPDGDADTYCDDDDNCAQLYNPLQSDMDGDGIGDDCDSCTDTDGDGFGNPGFVTNTCPTDNCPSNFNPLQEDYDSDGIGDSCDNCMDIDGDGWGDPAYTENACGQDNCWLIFNTDQSDVDDDGLGDACDECSDSDGDGWPDPSSATDTCPADNCPGFYNPDQAACAGTVDPVRDGVIDMLDVVRAVDIAFSGDSAAVDPTCPLIAAGADVNCDGVSSVLDVVALINVAIRGAIAEFCRPCDCDCYPHGCPGYTPATNLLPNNGNFERFCRGAMDGWLAHGLLTVELHNVGAPGGGEWSLFVEGG